MIDDFRACLLAVPVGDRSTLPNLTDTDLKAAIAPSGGHEATCNDGPMVLIMVQGEEQHLPDRELS